jgi:hypothetical protein
MALPRAALFQTASLPIKLDEAHPLEQGIVDREQSRLLPAASDQRSSIGDERL